MSKSQFTLAELAERFHLELQGDPNVVIDGVGTLQSGIQGQISFLANPKYRCFLDETSVSAVILGFKDQQHCGCASLVSSNPYAAYARVAALFLPSFEQPSGIHPSAVVDSSARLSESVSIGPMCVVGAGVVLGDKVTIESACVLEANVEIGARSRLRSNVTVCHSCELGTDVLVHPGVVIGSDGFGIAPDQGDWVKVPQLGRVVIGNGVEIGANTTIDRGALEDTILEDGVQLDNQIQIAHNVVIGSNTAIAGCTGIAGSTKIGKNCLVGGGVVFAGHLEVADKVTVTAMSFVSKSINKPGVFSSGVPAQTSRDWNKSLARLRRLGR